MNYYPFHVGDYMAHTAHLEPLEDIAYRRLLDVYYLREEPIPGAAEDAARLIRMRPNVAEVAAILSEFFELTPEGWRHSRCDAELAKMQDKQAKARASAAASVRVRSTNAQRTLSERSTDVELPTPTPTPTPARSKTTPSAAPTASAKLPDPPAGIDSQAWDGFVAMRKRERHPLTPRAAELILRKLLAMRQQGVDPNDALDQSTRNGWRDVFAPRAETGATHAANPPPRESLADRVARKCREADERDARTAAGWPEPAGDAHLLVAHGGDLRA